MSRGAQPTRAFISENARFGSSDLSAILRDADCEAIVAAEDSDLDSVLDSLLPPPDLMILPVAGDECELLQMVRNREWLKMVPVLAIGPPDCSGLDLWRLRGFGVVGLIDRRSSADHVRFRIDQVIGARSGGPRDARVSCCFLVDVEAAGEVSSEFAVSLSMGGLGLACARALEPNSSVRVWLPVATAPGGPVELPGRVVRRVDRADGRYDVGIAFLPLAAEVRDIVAAELCSFLLASGAQLVRSAEAVPSSARNGGPQGWHNEDANSVEVRMKRARTGTDPR